ncbi:MAG: leucine-rich repeat protein [Prevotella sp.]|nr:leucine-rich repeat protein [Prevotella sp.]
MIKKRLTFVLLLALLPFVGWAQNNEALYKKGEVIVKFKSGHSMTKRSAKNSDISANLRRVGITSAEQLMPLTSSKLARRAMGNGNSRVNISALYVLRFNDNQSVEEIIEKLKKSGDIEYAEPNYIVKAMGKTPETSLFSKPIVNEINRSQSYNDPKYSEQWGLQAINMPALWEKPVINSKRPVIAILDTGVDINHPDLATNIWTNAAEKGNDEDNNGFVGDVYGWDFVNNSPDISDPDGHGTHCAGIAAAVGNNGIGIVGANPDALIMPLKVLNAGGVGSVAATIQALDYAVANGANVISMSFGRACPGKSTHEGEMEAMEEAAKYAILVAATGNDGVCMNQRHQTLHGSGKFPDPNFPAAYPFVIGVQASNKDGSLADFSNFDCRRTPSVTVYGEKKTPLCYEILAPGVDIVSTLPSGEYGAMDGTSMACPLIAGAVSRILQTKTDIDNGKLLTMISLVSDNKVLDMIDLYNVKDNDMPKHAVDDIFTAVVEKNEITFRVTSATTVQVGDGSYPAVNNPSGTVTIPETVDGFKVTTIGSYAFAGTDVENVILPNSITFIANFAFMSCHVTSIDIPESVVDIGESAFSDSYVKTVYIPQNVDCVSESAFGSMPELKTIQVDSNNKRYDSRNNCNAIIETTTGKLVCGTNNIPEGVKVLCDFSFWGRDFESITIPNTVEEIGTNAFENCKNLKSIDIPESVVSIGFSAFNMCQGLKSVHLSKNVRYIGSGAFGYCQNIESFTIDSENPVFDSRENCNAIIETATNTLIHGFNCTTIPSTLEGIAYNSFYYCDKLESIYITKSVSRIEYCPFIGCHNLRSVVIDKDNPYYDSRDNCSAIIEKATNTFLWGNQHSSIPSGVKTLGIDAFWGSEFPAGTIIKVPEGVETIKHGSLNIWVEGGDVTFHIPSSIKHIDEYASQYEFKSLYCYRKTPLAISNYMFREVTPTATLYVPKGQKAAYEKAKGWKKFTTIVEMDVEGADPPIEIEPIVESQEATFVGESCVIDEETDLANVVIDNTYYTMDSENGDGYNDRTEALVLNSITVEKQMNTIQGAKVGEDAIRNNFNGIIFEVPAGTGNIMVDAQTIGIHSLMVQVGNNAPTMVMNPERGIMGVPFNVKEPTYVYLYASTEDDSAARLDRASSAGDNSVLLYGYKVTIEEPHYIPGDVNGDGLVNVTDIVATVNFIMEKPSDNFNKEAADLNGDGEVNVTDIVMMVKIIMEAAAREMAE